MDHLDLGNNCLCCLGGRFFDGPYVQILVLYGSMLVAEEYVSTLALVTWKAAA